MTAIDDKHEWLRANVVNLGEPIGEEEPVGDDGGSMRSYEFGTICFHPEIGAFEVHGLIGETYLNELGGPAGDLGFPASDEMRIGEGFLNTFERDESMLFFDPVSGMHRLDDPGARGLAALVSEEIGFTPVAAGVQHLCFPPGMIVGALRGMQFGLIAERLIHDDYCARMGCDPTHDYFDRTGSNVEYLVFLQSHNPGLRPRYRQLRRWKRPDILTDNPPRREWYEIKPLSPDGMIAFGIKFQGITSYIADHSLPYVPGTTYDPTPFIPIGSFPINGIVLQASLGVARRTAGLVDYQLCVEGDLVSVLATVALAALVAAILDAIIAASAALVVA